MTANQDWYDTCINFFTYLWQ